MRLTVANDGKSKDYLIHRNLLHRKSPNFADLKTFQQGEANHVHLNDMDHKSFCKLIDWVYERGLQYKVSDDLDTLIKAWAAADRLLMDDCKNTLMDLIRLLLEESDIVADLSEVHLVRDLDYSTHSILMQFFMDQVAFESISNYGSRVDFSGADGLESTELLSGFLKRLGAMSQEWCRNLRQGSGEPPTPSALEVCKYPDHAEGEECHLDGIV